MKVNYNPSRNWWSAPKNCTMTTNADIDDLDINGEGDLIFLSKGRVTVPKQIIFRKSSKGRGDIIYCRFWTFVQGLKRGVVLRKICIMIFRK